MNDTGRATPTPAPVDPGHILDSLAIAAWFTDADKIVRYVNAVARKTRPDAVAALGKNVEACHKPASVPALRALYEEWASGSRAVKVYVHPAAGGGSSYSVLVPVQGADGFEGVLELSFKV